MPAFNPRLLPFSFGALSIRIWVPAPDDVKQTYEAAQTGSSPVPAPYWARVWPAAIALCRFIAAHPELVEGKRVLELAAGLGLPGLIASKLAREVIISDYIDEAVALMEASVVANGLRHVTCRKIDWSDLPADLETDVLLLSDINYDPASFDVLFQVLMRFLKQGTTILLTTPQRLMARPFIGRLLPYCMVQQELEVALDDEQAFITVLVLRKEMNDFF